MTGSKLPTWEQMIDLDKGAVLLHLRLCEDESIEDAISDCPVVYFKHPTLLALDGEAASKHARDLFADSVVAWEALGDDEYERLYDLALDADRKRYYEDTLRDGCQ